MKNKFIAVIFAMTVIGLTACQNEQSETNQEEEMQADIFTVQVEIACEENLLFSRYDVNIFIDDELLGTLEHGATDTYAAELIEGGHTLKAEKEDESDVDGTVEFEVSENTELSYQLSLSSDQIEIEKIEPEQDAPQNEEKANEESAAKIKDTEENKDDAEEVLNVDNCEELAVLLSLKDEFNPSIAEFASKYQGRIIEFDGNVAYVSPHEGYSTRFDYLIYAGDYSESMVSGPSFQFEDVNYYDLHLEGDNVPDLFDVGLNIHVIAKIEEYDLGTGLFKLDPVKIIIR
ncbi:DUF4839 domain-containing protein [Mordavella massiliensis]|uniref:DUF4839 domain-containing protein n=1 Tax=Mordavella massiliensis TaxID=1871024 RepID=A0A939BH18_9CLOT|nr:DUF4839 domain-containing protein [Mordavella massiliensis]MBM6948743.1 DUF4839 domain-containing protein [Mordavella massiliensis]